MPNFKELKKLATQCRKLGIKHYKSAEFEFTLTDEKPLKVVRQSKKATSLDQLAVDLDIETPDQLTEQQLLYWSTGESDGVTNENN